MNKQALEGIRILDLSHVFQGPVGTQLLADYGADVIKLERPGTGDWSRRWGPFVKGVSLPFANLNRNKRSITVDMKNEEGKQLVLKLVKTADVIVHNFRVGVMEKLGFGYEELSKINPKLIYAGSSGWGDHGPDVDRKRGGHDMMARAEAGLFVDYEEGKAPIPGGISVDYPAGLMLMVGILIALHHRERTGKGQKVSTDLLSVAFHSHAWDAAAQLNQQKIDEPARIGGTEAAINKAFVTADGNIEVSPVFSDHALRDLSTAMGLGDLSLQPQFSTETLQIKNCEELNATLARRFLDKKTDEWFREFEANGVLCARINSFIEASENPQIAANNMVISLPHERAGDLRLLGTPLRLHSTPPSYRKAQPDIGQHSKEIAAELGYTDVQIEELQSKGILGGSLAGVQETR